MVLIYGGGNVNALGAVLRRSQDLPGRPSLVCLSKKGS